MPAPAPSPPSAAQVCAGMRLDPEAAALLAPAMTPREFVAALLEAGLHVPAIEVVAHALPRRLGVWWSLLCLEHAAGPEALPAAEANLCRLALRWIREPAEPVRAAAERLARSIGPASAAGQIGFAVGASATADGPVAIGSAVKLACVKGPPEAILRRQRAYALLGLGARLPPPGAPARSRPASILACA